MDADAGPDAIKGASTGAGSGTGASVDVDVDVDVAVVLDGVITEADLAVLASCERVKER